MLDKLRDPMAYPNPQFDPRWKEIHDYHAAKREHAHSEVMRLARAGEVGGDAYTRVQAEFDHHHQACLTALKAQHSTVQDYAAWLFREFDPTVGDWEGGVLVPVVDFDQLRSIEEAEKAWSAAHKTVEEAAGERRARLPTGQPDGLQAFADQASPTLRRYWREFSGHDLFPDGYENSYGTRTLITVDEQEDGWHVCFMHDWNARGISVTNAIEHLSSAVYREACALAHRQVDTETGLRAWLATKLRMSSQVTTLDPNRFHFYQHLPPSGGSGLREEFDRVDLKFRDGQFCEPQWRGYAVVPEAIQSARFACALETSRSAGGHLLLATQHVRGGPDSR